MKLQIKTKIPQRTKEEILRDLSLVKHIEDDLTKELEALNLSEEKEGHNTHNWHTENQTTFDIGDRVYINNQITPAGLIGNSKDRKATVKKISGEVLYPHR